MKTIYENNMFVTLDCENTTCGKCSCRTKDTDGWEYCSLFNLIILNEKRLELCKETEWDFRNFKTIYYYNNPLQVVVDEEYCGSGNRSEGRCQFLLWNGEDYPKCKLFGGLECLFRPQRHPACIEKAL